MLKNRKETDTRPPFDRNSDNYAKTDMVIKEKQPNTVKEDLDDYTEGSVALTGRTKHKQAQKQQHNFGKN